MLELVKSMLDLSSHTDKIEEEFGHLSETFPLSRDQSPSITLITSERGLTKKRSMMFLTCFNAPVLYFYPEGVTFMEGIDTQPLFCLFHAGGCSGTCLSQPCSCFRNAEYHKAIRVGQDPTLIQVQGKPM